MVRSSCSVLLFRWNSWVCGINYPCMSGVVLKENHLTCLNEDGSHMCAVWSPVNTVQLQKTVCICQALWSRVHVHEHNSMHTDSERCNGLWRGSRCVPPLSVAGTMERQSVIDSPRSAAVSRDEQTKLLRKRTMQMQDKQCFSRSDWDIAEVFATVDNHKSFIQLMCNIWRCENKI